LELKEYISNKITIDNSINSILSAIVYFDVFNFPLKKNELFEVSNFRGTMDQFDMAIKDSISYKYIKLEGEYYMPNYASIDNVTERITKENFSKKIKSKVLFYSNLISKFPFVESVSISGSYSKGVADKTGDIDYFIICTPQRLWICRTLLILFKKIFLLNSKKYFCVNYFIDSDNLIVPDKNLFVATEIKFLIPVYNHALFKKFQGTNKWTDEYLPNKKNQAFLKNEESKPSKIKYIIEKLLQNKTGDILDTIFFRITLKKWKRKFPEMNITDFDLNMRTRKNVSKHHPHGYQNKVLKAMEESRSKIYQTAKS
jgi:hypothetical protein